MKVFVVPQKLSFLLGMLLLMVFAVADVYGANEVTVDGTVTSAVDDYARSASGDKTTTGYVIGVSKDLGSSKFALRAELGYYRWSGKDPGYSYHEWSFTRIPLFIGIRVYYLTAMSVRFYMEGGFELAYDRFTSSYTGPLNRSTYKNSYKNFGITPGLGIEIPLNGSFAVGLNAKYHKITDPYSTIGLSLAYKF